MNFEVLGKGGFVPSQAITDYAEKRMKKVIRLLGEENISGVRVLCKVYKDHHKVEITVFAKELVIRAETPEFDIYAAIDKSIDKLVRQIHRHRERLQNHLDKTKFGQFDSNGRDVESLEKEVLAAQLVKNKKIELRPMTSEEAIRAMELTDHDFYIFLDKETAKTNVVYRREDGDYAVIETEPVR
jgi:putative sigma-54 modulation protein